jgi:hypothetical protein
MAIFNRDQLDRVDWPILKSGPITMYWNQEILNEDCRGLSALGYKIYTVDCRGWKSSGDALRGLGKALEFPDYYGQNLDALDDCLYDLDVPDDGGTAIVLMGFGGFAALEPKVTWHVLDILAARSQSFMLFGQRLAILLQSDDATLGFDRVGGTIVDWNRREWLNKNRGL